MTLEKQVRQAIARGYCHPDNSTKELDPVLIEAMVHEVVKTLTPKQVDYDDGDHGRPDAH